MAIPYTPEAVAALRHAAAKNIPAIEVQQQLGWDGAFLARVCQKHKIDIAGIVPSTPQIYVPPPPPLRVDMKDRLRVFAGELSGNAGLMLVRLIRYPVGDVVAAEGMGLSGSVTTAAQRKINSSLKRAGLPWRVDSVRRGIHASGYRLVKCDDGEARA